MNSNFASVELCKRLSRRLQWPHRGFVWDISYDPVWLRYIADFPNNSREKRGEKVVAAYDTSFLAVKTKDLIIKGSDCVHRLHIEYTYNGKWKACYPHIKQFSRKNLADALAELALWASENGSFSEIEAMFE